MKLQTGNNWVSVSKPLLIMLMRVPHTVGSCVVDLWLLTVNLSWNIIAQHMKLHWHYIDTVRTCTRWHGMIAEEIHQRRTINPEKISNVQKTSNKRDQERRAETLWQSVLNWSKQYATMHKLTIVILLAFSNFRHFSLLLVAKMHAACSHSPHNVLHSPSYILLYYLHTITSFGD